MPDPRGSTLTIPKDGTVSNALALRDQGAMRTWHANVYAPVTLAETVYVVHYALRELA